MIKPTSIWWIALLIASAGCSPSPAKPHDEHEEHPEGEHKEREGDEHHGEGHDEAQTVKLTPSVLERSAIRTQVVSAGTLAGVIEAPAQLQLNPDRVAHISPMVQGQLLSVDVAIGDKVERDQPMATLRSTELGQARADLSRTSSLREVALKNRERQERLRAEGINSERSLIEAQQAYEQANAEHNAARSRLQVLGAKGGSGPELTLESPISGVIVERHATRGESVSQSDTLFIVADMSKVWVIGQIYEQHVAQVRVGMSARLSLNAYPSRQWSGRIDYVGATLDERSRSLPIRVELENPDGQLKPGLFGTLQLSAEQDHAQTPLVPLTAIQTLKQKSVVFVQGDAPGVFSARQVTLGRQSRLNVEVLEGLKPGESIVVEGAFVLKSELMREQLGEGHAH